MAKSLADAPHCSIWGSVENQTISAQVLIFIYSNSQQDSSFFPARYREMTFTNVTFMYRKTLCEVKSNAQSYLLIKLSFEFDCHSLLWHLFRSEFAVLLFDCERYKLAAQSIP